MKKLTDEEITERDLYLDTELEDSKVEIKAIAKFNRHTALELKELEKFQRKIERGEIKDKKDKTVTEADFKNLTRLNRAWTPEVCQDCWDGIRCPLDLTLNSARFGGVEDAS